LLKQQLNYVILDIKKKNAIQDYLNKVISLMTQIQASNKDIFNVTYTSYLLHGLPKLYKTVKIIYGQSQNNVNLVKNILFDKYFRQKGKAILAKNGNGNSNDNDNPANAHAFIAGKDSRGGGRGKGLNKGRGGANRSS
jgi:hypothetical protein